MTDPNAEPTYRPRQTTLQWLIPDGHMPLATAKAVLDHLENWCGGADPAPAITRIEYAGGELAITLTEPRT